MRPDEAAGNGPEEVSEVDRRLFGRPNDHQKTVTMAAIARASGVSQGAISSLLNDRDYGIRVSQSTRDRVFQICRQLGYVPNDLRAIVRMHPEVGDLCLVLPPAAGQPESERAYEFRLVEALRQLMDGHPGCFSIATYQPDLDYGTNPEHLPRPVRLGTATKILIGGAGNESLTRALEERQVSMVALGSVGTAAGAVNLDYFEAGKSAIRYLASKGHRRIAVVAGRFGSGDKRAGLLTEGIEAGYRKAGLGEEDQNIIYGEPDLSNGANAVDVLWENNPPTAVFCTSDSAASGVLMRAKEKGLKVPKDFSLIGLGDEPMAEWLSPALTTFRIPYLEVARCALTEVEKRVRGEEQSETPVRVKLPFIERASVGLAR